MTEDDHCRPRASRRRGQAVCWLVALPQRGVAVGLKAFVDPSLVRRAQARTRIPQGNAQSVRWSIGKCDKPFRLRRSGTASLRASVLVGIEGGPDPRAIAIVAKQTRRPGRGLRSSDRTGGQWLAIAAREALVQRPLRRESAGPGKLARSGRRSPRKWESSRLRWRKPSSASSSNAPGLRRTAPTASGIVRKMPTQTPGNQHVDSCGVVE